MSTSDRLDQLSGDGRQMLITGGRIAISSTSYIYRQVLILYKSQFHSNHT